MLVGHDFSRHHQRRLKPLLDCLQHSQQRYHGLPLRIALKQAPHAVAGLHVGRKLPSAPRLPTVSVKGAISAARW